MPMENETKKPGWNTAEKEFYRNYKFIRQEFKGNMTPAEQVLWDEMKNRKLGVKFRRQHIIDTYIPDFVALSIKLVIEVDGKIHLNRKDEDTARTFWLNSMGYKVIRFKNEEVINNIAGVVEKIKMEIGKLTSPDLTTYRG
jgi:very-short-patch-repair endonuclease